MTTADQTLESARPLAAALVEWHERRVRSRMAAYEHAASTLGVSSSWLRKLIGRQPGIVIAAHEYLNLAAAYRSLCVRIEASAEAERQRFLALGRTADAALESAGELAAVAPEKGPGEAPR